MRLDGNKLIKTQIDENNPDLNAVGTMEFLRNGDEMRWTGIILSDDNIKSVRVYKREGIETRSTSGC